MSHSSTHQSLTMRDELEIVLGQVYPEMRDVGQCVSDLTQTQVVHLSRTLQRTNAAINYIESAVHSVFDDIVKGRVL